MEILMVVLKVLGIFFGLTFILYWFNLDMKFIYKITPWMMKHYDNIERDRRI